MTKIKLKKQVISLTKKIVWGLSFSELLFLFCAFVYLIFLLAQKTNNAEILLVLIIPFFIFLNKKKIKLEFLFLLSFFISFYSFFYNSDPYKSLLPQNSVLSVTGLINSQISLSEKGYYSFDFLCQNSKNQDFESTSVGTITVLIKKQNVFNKDLFDVNAKITFSGRFSQENELVFFAESYKTDGFKNNLYNNRAYARRVLKEKLKKYDDFGGFLLALLTADRTLLNQKINTDFKKAGLSYVLALSGMHLTIITMFLQKIIKPIFGFYGAIFLTVIASFLFLFFAGFSPSLVRAFLCLFFSSFFLLLGLKIRYSSILSFVFVIHLIIQPQYVQSPSFLLSYSSVWGIILLNEKLNFCLKNFFSEYVAKNFSFSSSAVLGSGLFSFLFFGTINLNSIFSSIIVVPIVTLFLILGIIFVFLLFVFEPFCSILAKILELLYFCFSFVASLFY